MHSKLKQHSEIIILVSLTNLIFLLIKNKLSFLIVGLSGYSGVLVLGLKNPFRELLV